MRHTVCLSLWIRMSVLYLLMNFLEAIPSEQRFAIEPQDQTAIVGSRVTLPCRVINKLGTLQWTRDDFALGTHRSLAEFFRYTMIGSDEEGDYSLAIEPVMLEDDAKYQCQVSSGPNGEPGIRSKYARLVVLVSPEKPHIIQGTKLETTEDTDLKLECLSKNGKPAAEITWVDGQGNVIIKNIPGKEIAYSIQYSPESQLYTARSVLTLQPKMNHHNTTFTCQAQNAADRIFKSAKIQLLVKYAPKVTLTVISSSDSHMLKEGLEAKLVCQADANPPVDSYRWFLNDELKSFPTNVNEFIIPNISRYHHNSIVKCEALNTIGKSEDSQTLDVKFGPKFKQKPKSVQTDAGIVVQLTCDVESNPPPEITWTHSNEIVGHSSNLTLNVSLESIGRYYCQARAPDFLEIGAEAYVHMNGPPAIQKNHVQYGVVGDMVRLHCSVYSVPRPQKTTWSFNGQIIDVLQQDFSILEDPLPEGIQSTLVIRNSRQEHFGVYNCSVSNSYGTDILDIILKPQKGFPLTVTLTAAIGGGITLITLIIIVLMCQSTEKKPHSVVDLQIKQIEKPGKESDRFSSLSELKLEMQTGSSTSNINCESDYGGDHDSDSIITRVAVPLAGPISADKQYSANHYLYDDFNSAVSPKKMGQNNNSYKTYLGHSRCTLANGFLPIMTSNGMSGLTTTASLDMRYSATYCNPYLRIDNHSTALSSSSGSQHLPPPPYTTSNNGSVPQLTSIEVSSKSSSPAPPFLPRCLIPTGKMQHIVACESMTQQATHV